MGYYLPHKSYLRPKQKGTISQRTLMLSTAGAILVAAAIVVASAELGESKTAAAQDSNESIPFQTAMTSVVNEEPRHITNSEFPVDLAFFVVNPEANKVELKWSTQSEYKNEKFILEKSENGNEFTELVALASKGTVEMGSSYSYVDDSPASGLLFYRLRQVSENGKSSFIGLEKILLDNQSANLALYIDKVGPQPFENYFNIGYYSEREGGVSVEIYDKSGQSIYKTYTMAKQGYNTCRFVNGADLVQSEYTVRIANSTGAFVKKIRKKI